MAGSASLWC